MGVHNVGPIAQKLIAAGRHRDTPAAMIQMAYWDGEHVVTATLRNHRCSEVRRAGVEPPATLVVGEVVRLREKLKKLMACKLRAMLQNRTRKRYAYDRYSGSFR